LEKIIQQQKNPEDLMALLANVVAILKDEQPKEETTSILDQLPLENWTDIFGFLPRPQLAELVPEIGDWCFAEKAQDYLHEYGRITLGDIYIRESNSWINGKNGIPIPIVKLYDEGENNPSKPVWEYPLADVPIPKNIIDFGSIHIRLAFSNSYYTFPLVYQLF
jgi:hypothetical protein